MHHVRALWSMKNHPAGQIFYSNTEFAYKVCEIKYTTKCCIKIFLNNPILTDIDIAITYNVNFWQYKKKQRFKVVFTINAANYYFQQSRVIDLMVELKG